jgi:tetratricopeptide (TPR) repeat protein
VPSTEEQPNLARRRIGSCLLVRAVAAGGMGVVYEAVQEPPGRTVAVKLLRWALADERARVRFEHEARLLGSIEHPGVCRVYEAGVHADPSGEDLPYFVMEFVPGARTIVEHARERALPRPSRIELIAQVCDALHAIHQRGIVHRDVKPANVLVDSAGAPKVIDFGIARSLEVGDRTVTRPGTALGTLAYTSPEQIAGDRDAVDVRSDVYALGVTAYEVLTGRLPHDLQGLDVVEAARVVLERPPVPPETADPTLAGDLSVILRKALAKDPERRYGSAAELAADLRRFVRHQPILARPPRLGYTTALWARRHRAASAAAALVLLALVAAVVVSAAYAASEATQRETADVQRRRAEHLLRQGKDFAPWVLSDLDREIRRLAGSTPVRRKLADGVRGYLDALTATESDDPEILGSAVRAYATLGELEGGSSFGNLGRHGPAEDAFRRAMALSDRLRRLLPDDAEGLWGSLYSRGRLGELLAKVGRTADATTVVAEALAIAETAAPSARLAPLPQDEVVVLRQVRARIAIQERRADDALADLVLVAETRDADPRVAAGELEPTLRAIGAWSEVLRTLMNLERLEEAAPAAARVAVLVDPLVDRSNDPRLLTRVLRAQADLAELDRLRGRSVDAAARLKKVLAAFDAWAARDPADVYPRRMSMAHRLDLARALGDAGKAEEAVAAYARAAETGRALLATAPNDAPTEWNLFVSEMERGDLLRKEKRHAEAEEAYRGAREVAQRRSSARPDDVRETSALVHAELGLARAAMDSARLPGAHDAALSKAREAKEAVAHALGALRALKDAGRLPADEAGTLENAERLDRAAEGLVTQLSAR